MVETANIAAVAEIISKDLFSEFYWEKSGEWNINWGCEEQERHKCKTHPSDVVFYYDEPYKPVRTYINCDLKSYARGTINSTNIKGAIEGLARSLTCAEKSDEWRQKYIHNNSVPEICGLLFIYNHDGGYDKDFFSILNSVRHESLEIPKGSKIVVIGPYDIFWLNNVIYEIVMMRGKKELPDKGNYSFHYPNLVLKKNVQQQARAATLEMLTAPWITLSYDMPDIPNKKGYVVFYKRRGDSVEEFLYLIDYLMHYQILSNDSFIKVKSIDPDPQSSIFFDKAKQQYADECGGGEKMKEKLNKIKYNQLTQLQTKISLQEIGMRNG
jgi:hypothetical protein